MSDVNENTVEETETPKKKGQKRRTEQELRTAFAEMKEALGCEGLSLQVKDGQCTVLHTEGDQGEVVLGPVAGNTFMKQIEGAHALARFVR